MLDSSVMCFPMNAVDLIAIRLESIDPETAPGANDGIRIYKRPLRVEDDTETIGITADHWIPDKNSMEMRGGTVEPTLQRYTVNIQGLVKDADEDRGIATHSLLCSLIRSMLYRDIPLGLAFRELSVTVGGVREKSTKWGVVSQHYLNNQLKGSFIYLSRLEFYIETQSQ